MNQRTTRLQRAAQVAAGVVLGASIVTPAYAAMPALPEQWQPFLLIGSVVLLAVALMLKALGTRHPRVSDTAASVVDMRDAYRAETTDVPMHQ
ncbi:MAG: hypothetical protein ACREYD_01305 [Casimicrobiaceae bacterium]